VPANVYLRNWPIIHDRQIDKHDKMDPIIWQDGSLVDWRIRVNGQAKPLITELKGTGHLLVPKEIAVGIIKGLRYRSTRGILTEYQTSLS